MSPGVPWPRISRLLLEVASIVFAVLVALAVDEWWEERENRQRAAQTLQAIASEIRSNRRDIMDFGDAGNPDAMLSGISDALAMYRAGELPRVLSVNWDIALLSSAAWQTAQLTSSAPYMGLERVVELAEVYEFQRLYLATQDDLVRRISGIEARLETEPVATLIELRSQFAMALALRRNLATIYACTLVELEGPEVVEAGECPDGEENETIRLESAP